MPDFPAGKEKLDNMYPFVVSTWIIIIHPGEGP